MYYVYILQLKNGFYSGCTSDLKERISRHKKGQVSATKSRLPLLLKNYITFPDKYSAFEFERYLKSGSGRAFCKKHFNVQ